MAANQIPQWAQALRARREAISESEGTRITQEDVAARTGDLLSQRTVSHLEKGTIELGSLAFSRVVAFAKALDWTLSDLQRATGLDLGVADTVVEQGTASPIYRIQNLLDPDPKADSYTFVQTAPGRQLPSDYIIVYADSDEMATGEQRSIRPGDQVFIDTQQPVKMVENNVYVIAYKGKIHIRRYRRPPEGFESNGDFFVADNPIYSMHAIPVENASVIGRVFRFISDQFERPSDVKN